MNPVWLLRMAKWVRHPPSPLHVKVVFGVVLLCLIVGGLEWMGWWPDWAKAEPMRRR